MLNAEMQTKMRYYHTSARMINRKQSKYSIGKWLNKLWDIHTMEYYSARSYKLLIHAKHG